MRVAIVGWAVPGGEQSPTASLCRARSTCWLLWLCCRAPTTRGLESCWGVCPC